MSQNAMVWEVCELSNLEALGSGFEEQRLEIRKISEEKQSSKQKPEHSHSGQSAQPESVTDSAGGHPHLRDKGLRAKRGSCLHRGLHCFLAKCVPGIVEKTKAEPRQQQRMVKKRAT